jgi:hypothetical protein
MKENDSSFGDITIKFAKISVPFAVAWVLLGTFTTKAFGQASGQTHVDSWSTSTDGFRMLRLQSMLRNEKS